jgi:hypothetical protein
MILTTQERITLEKALKMFWDSCIDEIHEKKDIPGEQKAVDDDYHQMRQIDLIVKKLDLHHPSQM